MPPDTNALLSAPNWSEDGAPAAWPVAPNGPHPDAHRRYVRGSAVGAGAMGVVVVAWDPLLQRNIAVKTASPAHPNSAARLRREATILAKLEHPNIVPVFDSGTDADGLPWLAMRLVNGQTLARQLAQDVGRLSKAKGELLRALLGVCQATAHAHGRGVLHRDLKPDNILVDAQGGVQVVDWGLACTLGEPDAVDDDLADHPSAATHAGAVLGTPLYMSPEATLGQPLDRRSDVFCLGAVLYQVATGQPLRQDSTAAGALAAARRQRDVAVDLPADPELAAIVQHCLVRDPHGRYADAAALATDLANYLDGRRVTAHAYTPAELARRLVRAWRWQIVAALTVGAVGVTGAVVSTQRVLLQKDRAETAERVSAAALRDTKATRAHLMVGQAAVEAERKRWGHAAVLAAAALFDAPEGGETQASARGMLMATVAASQFAVTRDGAVPPCRHRETDPTGHYLLCYTATEVQLWSGAPLQQRWRQDRPADYGWMAPAQGTVFLRRNAGLDVVDLATGKSKAAGAIASATVPLVPVAVGSVMQPVGARAVLTAADGRQVLNAVRCPGAVPQEIIAVGTATAGATALLACGDATVYACPDRDAPCLAVAKTGLHARDVTAVAETAGSPVVIVATARGELVRCDRTSTLCDHPVAVAHGVIRRLQSVGSWTLAVGDRGDVHVVCTATMLQVVELPGGPWTDAHLGAKEILTVGATLRHWRLPDQPLALEIRTPPGSSLASLDVRAPRLAVGLADGTVQQRSPTDGAVAWQQQLQPGVVKAVALAGDATLLASGPGEHRLLSLRQAGASAALAAIDVRRMVVLQAPGGEVVVGATFGQGLVVQRLTRALPAQPTPPSGEDWLDLAPTVDHTAAIGFEAHAATVVQLQVTDAAVWPVLARTLLLRDGSVHHVAAAVAGAGFLTGAESDLRWYGKPLDPQPQSWQTTARICDLAVAPQGPWLIAGLVDGTVAVWQPGHANLLAQTQLHTERVAALVLAPDGQRLWSGSWDGTVRLYDLGPLGQPPEDLLRHAQRAWGLTLQRAAGGQP